MKVLKFGGSSVKDSTNINKVFDILKSQFEDSENYTVVVSALGGVTDQLIEMSSLAAAGKAYLHIFEAFSKRHLDTANELLSGSAFDDVEKELLENHEILKNLLHGIYLVRESSPRTSDFVLSFGERNSAFIIAKTFTEKGINAQYLDARKIIKTDKTFGSATVHVKLSNELISNHYKNNSTALQVVTGFISSDVGGLTTTLGRGGSDFTASLLAAALDAKALEIWTDVDGVLTCDPRKVKSAFTIPSLSYSEAMELSHFGAKVIYPPTIQPALQKNIPIFIRNTFNPSFTGTVINKETKISEAREITGLSSLSDISLLRLQGSGMIGIPGISARLFSALARKNINIILISQASSEHSICIAVKNDDSALSKTVIENEFEKELEKNLIDEVLIESNLSIVAVVGEKMRNIPGVAGKLFTALGKNGINVIAIAQGSSELNISFVVSDNDTVKALNLIHDSFFLSGSKQINVFMIGVGLIGGTLLEQVKDYKQKIFDQYAIRLNFVGISNSKKMIFDDLGLDIIDWKNNLNGSSLAASPKKFLDIMFDMNLPNSVFVDCTANNSIPGHYFEILDKNINIVTPNKVAASSSFAEYNELKSLALKKNIDFLYETNVGAGLPIISTIKNLINSGDKIIKLEAVLSGTISYIFNSFNSDKEFSAVVKDAQDKGLTEPDPRDDLSGSDVKRKITILARECGIPLEMDEVMLQNILTDSCLNAHSVSDFYEQLEKDNSHFGSLVEKAEKQNKKLRYVASLENGQAEIKLIEADKNNPFYSLEGSDNMVTITSNRYNTRPLVIKGPGAGASVTAAGVFSEILYIATKTNN